MCLYDLLERKTRQQGVELRWKCAVEKGVDDERAELLIVWCFLVEGFVFVTTTTMTMDGMKRRRCMECTLWGSNISAEIII